MWAKIRSRQIEGAKFVRQFPIGPRVADFACREAGVVIELDGGQHNETADAGRTATIESFGYRIVRFWNHEVFENTEGVLEAIRQELHVAFDRQGRAQG